MVEKTIFEGRNTLCNRNAVSCLVEFLTNETGIMTKRCESRFNGVCTKEKIKVTWLFDSTEQFEKCNDKYNN